MSELSLQQYLDKVHALLQAEAATEAVAHSRHILAQFPKNAEAYRILGEALLLQKQWNEAAEVFRRLLAARPTDARAHRKLSEAYEHLGDSERAIWHMERAFDQKPSDAQINSALRRLHKQYRQQDLTKIPLTAGAVATQYMQGGIYDQAADALRKALQKSPERSDLRLMLAQALWNLGRPVDAAETALEVLKQLPFAVEANRILTQLWLQEQRPSDAQRYLARMEAIDPYAAYQLATGNEAAPEVFSLRELDYQTTARRQLQEQSPDWLASIAGDEGAAPVELDDSWLDSVLAEEQQETKRKVTDSLADIEPSPWDENAEPEDLDDLFATPEEDAALDLSDLFEEISASQQAAPSQPEGSTGITGLIGMLENVDEEGSDAPQRPTGFTGLLGLIGDDEQAQAESTGLTDLLNENEDKISAGMGPGEPTGLTGLLDEEPAAVRESTGLTGLFDDMPEESEEASEEAGGLLGFLGAKKAAEVPQAEADDDWLNDLDQIDEQLLSEEDWQTNLDARRSEPMSPLSGRVPTGLTDAFSDESAAEEEDAMAWAHDLGVEEEDELEKDAAQAAGPTDFTSDPNAWLSYSGIEVSEEEAGSRFVEEEHRFMDASEADAMAWARSSDIDIEESEEDFAGQFSDFVQDADEEADLEALDWESADEPTVAAAASGGWQEEDDILQQMLELESLTGAGSSEADVDALDWESPSGDAAVLSDMEWLEEEAEPIANIHPDDADSMAWMKQYGLADEEGDEEAYEEEAPPLDESVSEEEILEEAPEEEYPGADETLLVPPQRTSMLDRLRLAETQASEGPTMQETPREPESSDDSFDFSSGREEEAGDEMDWLNEFDEEPELEEEAEALGDEFAWEADLGDEEPEAEEAAADWLSEIQPEAEAELEEEAEALGDEFAWEADLGDEEPEAEEAAADWLSEIQPEAEAELEEEAEALGDEFAWEADLGDEEPEAEEAAADWLSEIQPEAEAELEEEAEAEAAPGWLSDYSSFSSEEPAQEDIWGAEPEAEEVLEEDLDWMLEPEEENLPSAATGMTGLLSEIQAQRSQHEEEVAPDWLDEFEPQAEAEAAPDWLDQFEPQVEAELEEEAEEAEVAPDWLDSYSSYDIPEQQDESFAFEEDLSSEPAWMAELESDEERQIAAEETPDWLSELQPATAQPLDEVEEIDFDEEIEVQPADNAPDWLNAMVPGLDVDFTAAEDEPLDAGFEEEVQAHRVRTNLGESEPEMDWLEAIVEEESQNIAPVMPATPPPPPMETPAETPVRFTFSKPPTWLQRLREGAAASASAAEQEAIFDQEPDFDLSDLDEDDDIQPNDMSDFDFDFDDDDFDRK